MTPIDVCAAVAFRGERLLLATRPADSHLAGTWEFPGGKVHDGESLEDCIRRELLEELDLDVRQATHIATVEHTYPDKLIRLHFMRCRIDLDAVPQPQEGQRAAWFLPDELDSLDLAPADRTFVLTHLSSAV